MVARRQRFVPPGPATSAGRLQIAAWLPVAWLPVVAWRPANLWDRT
jgi:hypothetical protein